jgi:hypothetical protein
MRHFYQVSFLVICVILVSGCTQDTGDQANVDQDELGPQTQDRDFLMGVVPNPKAGSGASWDDIVDAYVELSGIAEVSMVWTGQNIGQAEKLRQTQTVTSLRVYGIKPILTLNVATIKEVPGEGLVYAIDAPEGVRASLDDPEFRELWVGEARDLAGEFQPEYLSLGNEINDFLFLNPGDLQDYLSLFEDAYSAVKMVSPGTKVFAVVSYNHLIENEQWDLLESLCERGDLIGLTTYPWQGFDNPGDLPEDYYRKVEDHCDKPLAFTEIGWVSDPGTGSSEKEQAAFLERFLELTKGLDLEMVNWLFLHETELGGLAGSVSRPETGTIALKRMDGTGKEVYRVWMDNMARGYNG